MIARGFIFSSDAMLALVVVVILSGALVLNQQAMASGKELSFGQIDSNASDAAMLGFYSGKNAQDLGLAESAPVGGEFKCRVVKTINASATGSVETAIGEKAFCEVTG